VVLRTELVDQNGAREDMGSTGKEENRESEENDSPIVVLLESEENHTKIYKDKSLKHLRDDFKNLVSDVLGLTAKYRIEQDCSVDAFWGVRGKGNALYTNWDKLGKAK
jgi:hypothetical protein